MPSLKAMASLQIIFFNYFQAMKKQVGFLIVIVILLVAYSCKKEFINPHIELLEGAYLVNSTDSFWTQYHDHDTVYRLTNDTLFFSKEDDSTIRVKRYYHPLVHFNEALGTANGFYFTFYNSSLNFDTIHFFNNGSVEEHFYNGGNGGGDYYTYSGIKLP